MGKRRFAGTLLSNEHKTTTSKYGSNIEAWIRGWNYGVEIFAKEVEGEDHFEVWTCGGSNARSNGRRHIGTLTPQGFVFTN